MNPRDQAHDPSESELRTIERKRRAQERAERKALQEAERLIFFGEPCPDQPTVAERANQWAAQVLANMEHVGELLALFEAIEDAVAKDKWERVRALANLGSRNAQQWVDQLSEVYDAFIQTVVSEGDNP